mgnify:CR=1 FL=1
MSANVCPFCGSNNESGAAACRVCGVDFTQLPDELKPKEQVAESESANMDVPREEDQSGIPAWLRKRMNNQSNNKEVASFDSYLDAILGKPKDEDATVTPSSGEISQPGLFGEEDFNALLVSNEESTSGQLTDEEHLYTDFSMFRPEKKWEDIVSNESKGALSTANEDVYTDFSHFRPEKKWEDDSSAVSKNPAVSENESDYIDFSIYRPEKKWDERIPVASESSPVDSPLSDSDPSAMLEEQEFTRSVNAKSSDDQLALFDTLRADNDSSPTDFEMMGLEQAELPYVDFSVYRPARKWDDGPDEVVTGKEIREASDQLLSVANESSQFEETEDEMPIAADGLVGNFLNQIGTAAPIGGSDNGQSLNASSGEAEEELPEAHAADELDFLFDSQPVQPVDADMLVPSLSAEPDTQPTTAGSAVEAPLEFDFDSRDNVTPGNAGVDQSLDEVPWNLFEADPTQLSCIPGEPVYATFSRSGLEQPVRSSDYQERMIFAILEKIFKIEGINHPFVRAETRKTRKSTLFLLALVLLTGVSLLLLTSVSDSIPLTLPTKEDFPDLVAFNQALDQVESGSSALIVIDYTPGYSAELNASVDTLLANLSQKSVKPALVTANPLAVSLVQSIVDRNPIPGIQNLGFRAGGVVGMSDLLASDPSPYGNVYLITASFNSMLRWAEQSVLWVETIPLHVISSTRLQSLVELYRQAAVFTSQLTGSMEKQLFSGTFSADPQTRRKLFAVWFLLGMAILMIVIGYFVKNPFRSIVAVPDDNEEAEIMPPPTQREEAAR